jgi:hypothetical protein
MKNQLLTLLVVITSLATSRSQNNPYWIAGGNPLGGVDGVTTANNVLGPIGNVPLKISSNTIQRIFVNGGSAITGGFVGIGPNFSAPTNLLHLNAARNSFSQFTNGTTGATGTDGLLVGVADGGAGTAGHAWINQQENFPIDFLPMLPSE